MGAAVLGDHVPPAQVVHQHLQQLVHGGVEHAQGRNSTVGQGDGDQRDMYAGPAAGGTAGLQPVGLLKEAVLAHKGPGPLGRFPQIGLDDLQIGLQALLHVHNLPVEGPQLLRGTHAQIPVEQIGRLFVMAQGGGILSLAQQGPDDQGVQALVQGIELAGAGTQFGHGLKFLRVLQQIGVLLYRLQVQGMIVGADGYHPHLVGQLGQVIAPIHLGGLLIQRHALLGGQGGILGPAAQQLESVHVHLTGDGRIPGVGPPLGKDGLQSLPKQRLQQAAHPIEQGLERIGRIGAVFLRPEQLDKLRLRHGAFPMGNQVTQHVPQLLGAIDLIGEHITVYPNAKAAQHSDGDPFDHGHGCVFAHRCPSFFLPGAWGYRFKIIIA